MQSLLIRRLGAFIIDVVLLFAVLGPLGYFLQRVLGISPTSAQGVYATLVVNFSLPVWAYFALSDHSQSGATLGKRLLSLHTEAGAGGRLGGGQSFGRTALKMLPWEIAHASAFLFAPALGAFALGNWMGIGASYALSLAYLFVAWRTGGHRSVHDLASSTRVERSGGH